MKKLINDPGRVVDDALAGMAAAHGDLIRVIEPNVIVRKDAPRSGKVGVISGGGSGHEPMHGGFVGMGMLDAACPGAVFTSPVPDQMIAATKAVDGGAGVLHIVKNYTGDIMNFELAAELAQGEGIKVASVIIDDDVAVQDSPVHRGTARRRRHRARREDRRERRPRKARTLSCGRGALQRVQVNGRVAHGHGADLLHRPRSRQTDLRARRTMRWRSASASTASPAASAGRWRPRTRSPQMLIDADPRRPALRRRGSRARLRQRHGRHAADRALRRLQQGRPDPAAAEGSPSTATWSGATSPRSRWPAARSRLLKLDDEMTRYWDAPVHTPALRWGV